MAAGDEARAAFQQARFVLVLTGAGVSSESGVPTFRGPGGWWRQRHFSELATPEAFAREPRTVWDWYLERRAAVRSCRPNAAHAALADCVLVVGTTGVVQPAAGLVSAARSRGAVEIEVNPDEGYGAGGSGRVRRPVAARHRGGRGARDRELIRAIPYASPHSSSSSSSSPIRCPTSWRTVMVISRDSSSRSLHARSRLRRNR